MNVNNTKRSIGKQDVGPYYWIGKCNNGIEYFAGQTFNSQSKAVLKTIKIHPVFIVGSTDIILNLFELNNDKKEWKTVAKETSVFVDKTTEGQWIEFAINNVPLDASKKYGFKVRCKNAGMIAISENPWTELDPYKGGEEWVGSSANPEGTFHKDFDLAFEAIIE